MSDEQKNEKVDSTPEETLKVESITEEISKLTIDLSMQENYNLLKENVEALNSDYEKFKFKKVKASGQRSRNTLLNIKKLCDTLRKQIIADMRQLPTKHRIRDLLDLVKVESVESEESTESEESEESEDIPPPPELVREKTIKIRKPRKANKVKV